MDETLNTGLVLVALIGAVLFLAWAVKKDDR